MTKKLPAEVKQSRKPTRVACAFCHSKHLQCDSLRPCKNCVKRGLGDSCCDAVRKKKGKRSSQETKRSSQSTSGEVSCGDKISGIELPVSSSTSSSLDATISTVPTVGTTEGSVTARSDNKDDSRVQNQMISIGNLNHSVGDHTSSTSGVPNPEIHQNQNSNVSDQTANNDSKPKKRGRPPGSKSSTNKPRKQTKISNDKNQNHNQNKTKTKSDDRNDEHTIKNKLHIDTVNSKDEETVVENKLMTTPILPLPSLSANTSHLPLLNLANATLSQLNLNQFLRPETPHNTPNASHSHTLSDFKLPSFSDLKNAPLFSNLNLQGLNEGLSNSKPPQFDVRLTTFSPVIGDVKSNPSTPGLNILSNGIPNLSSAGINNLLNMHRENKDENNNSNNSIIENPQPIDKKNMIESITVTTNNTPMNPPVSPGSPLEFSVSNNSRTDTNANSHHSSFAERSLPNGGGNRVTPQEVISSGSSIRNFESAVANDEYVKLTDLLNDNVINKTKLKLSKLTRAISPPMDNESFLKTISPNQINFHGGDIEADDELDEDEDNDSRPFIIINLEDNSMISSYKNNSTPNSFLFNPDHSQMTNTAKQIPSDFQQDEDYTSPLIMRHMIKQPDDIYLTSVVKAYQYPKAYHALIAYLKKRFNKIQLIEIAKCMARYRPSFISATKSLYENDLIFTERSFQRTLLEYENLISMSTSPTIIWRRTGEIVALTNEFAIMTGYSKMSLLSKRTFIVELMDDESTINYFRSFSDFAFGDLNATHLTDCNLRKAEDDNYLRCACVWTIKRDVFDIPMLIVGQFLPVLE